MPQQVSHVAPQPPPGPAWLKMFAKQFDVFNVGITPPPPGDMDIKPRILLSGGRMTGKTIAITHRIMRHLWETPGARAAIFAKTQKVAKDGGIWEDIMDAAREWISAGLFDEATGATFEFTTKDSTGAPGPKIDSTTRTIGFKIRNRFGGESELKLFSLEHDHEIEGKVKSTRFSLMWFSELSLYDDPKVMNVSYRQLRMKHLKPWQHLWISDTNPHEDGEDHWIYKVWYKHRLQDEKSMREDLEKRKAGALSVLVDPERLKAAEAACGRKLTDAELTELVIKQKLEYRKSLVLIEIFLDDNTFLAPGDRLSLIEDYENDPGEYARNVEGKWVKGHGNIGKHFADIFSEVLHVVGSDDPNVGDTIQIDATTFELPAGWDLGDVNHSFHALEKRIVNGECSWCVLDEHVLIKTEISIAEFTMEVVEKMEALEREYGRKFMWNHWSDSSSIDLWKASGEGGSQAVEVEAASGGRIILQAAAKPKYSVRARVKLLQYFLRKNRFFVAHRCKATIEMLWHCSRGKLKDEYVLQNQYKHPFDSLSYAVYMETMQDPDSAFLIGNKPKARSESGVKFVDALGNL